MTKKYPAIDVNAVILAAYTITGCDTVSYPFRIGKKRALKVALENTDILEPLAAYGDPYTDLTPTAAVVNSARFFLLCLIW